MRGGATARSIRSARRMRLRSCRSGRTKRWREENLKPHRWSLTACFMGPAPTIALSHSTRALDAPFGNTGARQWRFYTVPGPGEPGHETWEGDSWKIGGAPAWITGTYDPATNTTFWTTGNPSPSNRGEGRAGDNLYSNSLLALDPATGKLKWYFQFTKHDEHDYDATQVPVLVED